MSTRCQIDFSNIQKYRDHQDPKHKKIVTYKDRVRIYHHWDGYPDNIIPKLKKFYKWVTPVLGDAEYVPANFIFWCKLDNVHESNGWRDEPERVLTIPKLLYPDKKDANARMDMPYHSFGICSLDGFHGDIEYFYDSETLVDGTQQDEKAHYIITIKCYKCGVGPRIKKYGGYQLKLVKTEIIKYEDLIK